VKRRALDSDTIDQADTLVTGEGAGAGAVISGPIADAELVAGSSLWRDAWRRLLKNKLAVLGGIIVILVVVISIFGALSLWFPGILPYTYDQIDLEIADRAPSASHWFGTDQLGRDIGARLLVGGAISLTVGLVATAVSFVIGVAYGAVSGFLGGRTDQAMMRLVDIIYSLPYIFVVIVLVSILGRSFIVLFAALGAVSWLTMARIVRGQVLSLKNQEFVEAARSIGVSRVAIIFRHLVPNTLGPVIVYTTLTIPSVMLQEAFLSFLGLGVPPPYSSWGTMVNEGVGTMGIYPWQLLIPAATLAITLFSLNFLGDGLRDALDPQMRKE
jgi:oligopeptide transport system permease protein